MRICPCGETLWLVAVLLVGASVLMVTHGIALQQISRLPGQARWLAHHTIWGANIKVLWYQDGNFHWKNIHQQFTAQLDTPDSSWLRSVLILLSDWLPSTRIPSAGRQLANQPLDGFSIRPQICALLIPFIVDWWQVPLQKLALSRYTCISIYIIIISPVSEGSGDVMVLRRSRPPPTMVLTR